MCYIYTRQSCLDLYRSLLNRSAVVLQICVDLLLLLYISITLTDFSNVALKKKRIKAIHTVYPLFSLTASLHKANIQ